MIAAKVASRASREVQHETPDVQSHDLLSIVKLAHQRGAYGPLRAFQPRVRPSPYGKPTLRSLLRPSTGLNGIIEAFVQALLR